MPAPICTTTSTIQCPHGGMAILLTSDTQMQIQGAFALLETDVHPVAGCPFMLGLAYHPCVTIRWSAGATQTKVNGIPVLLQTSVGVCYAADQAPQGVALITQVQSLALGI
jgi:hypothetical protein